MNLKKWTAWIGVPTIAFVAVACWSFDAARTLFFGWAEFLIRVIPRIRVDWSMVAAAVVVFALCTVGIHWFGRASLRARGSERRWRLGWSLVVSTTVVVAFAAGICMIGAAHQTGWVLTNKQPEIVAMEEHRYRMNHSSREQLRTLWYGLQMADQGSFWRGSEFESVQHSWATHSIMYCWYMPANEKGDQIDFQLPWNDPKNRPLFFATVHLFTNPDFPGAPLRDADGCGLAHYAANSRAMANGMIRPFDEFTDGRANTLLIGEVNANFRPWGDPANVRDPARGINRSPYGFGGPPQTRGALFSMADGSVRFVSERISPEVLRALATPDGGETVDLSVLEKR